MQKRGLGQTNIEVSQIGLGTVKFGRNQGVKYPHSFALPSMAALDELLGIASDLGINLIDTAPAYGESETRLGSLLKNKRHQWIISTKVGEQFIHDHDSGMNGGKSFFNFTPQHIKNSIDESLKRLATDYLDIVLVHSNGDDVHLIENEKVFATLAAIKQAGKIRAFGMSTKTIEGGLQTIALADVVMVAYNPWYRDEHEVIAYAHQQQKGILIKKAFASGHLSNVLQNALNPINHVNPYADALQFILAEPGVTSIIIGTINGKHLRENARFVAS